MAGKGIDLNSPEVQDLICTDNYGNDYLYIDELDPYTVSFPIRVDEEETLCL